jgi:hypothetical protein
MSKDLVYKLPLTHVIADYEVQLENAIKDPEISSKDKEKIEKEMF